ncbi:MAG TPA: hypothetical protein VHY34_12810 [Caulobacteraceae bacterium]|jgi:BASS family bile acid:Na+ symporter|nr:hypothetical protein [Caulobacteraceae bacterium]
MEHLKTILQLAASGSVGALVLAVGLDATLDNVLYVLRRPALLARAFLAISVIVPAIAVIVVYLLPLTLVVKVGVILMALAPVPPLVPRKNVKQGGRKEYVYGLYVAFAVLAIVIVPATVSMLNRLYGSSAQVPMAAMERTVSVVVLLPLVIGLVVRAFWPKFAAAAKPWVSRLSMLLLLILIVPIVVVAFPAIARLIGNGTVLAILLIVLAGIVGGHLLGGPDPRDRATLAATAATRHPGIAMLIANASFQDMGVAAVVLLFLLEALVIVALYQAWLRRSAHPQLDRAAGSPT